MASLPAPARFTASNPPLGLCYFPPAAALTAVHTGRLLFCQALILILLEGSPPSLKEYLRLQRTVTVDVDAAGRKCRERMMDVVMMRDVVMMGDAQPQQRCFHDFRWAGAGVWEGVLA